MAISSRDLTNALVDALKQELDGLVQRGVRMTGNATSSIVLVKGELNRKSWRAEIFLQATMERRFARR